MVRQLEEMGLGDELANHHRFEGLRALAFGHELLLRWPDHPAFGRFGYVITRAELDGLVAARAEKVGALVIQGCEAIAPLGAQATSGGPALGAVVKGPNGRTTEIVARFVVVADGANSRFGRVPARAVTDRFPRAWRFAAITPRPDTMRRGSSLDST